MTHSGESTAGANAGANVPAGGRRPLRILLPEGSSTSARQALFCLQPDDAVDILDPNPLCQCRFSRWRRRWYRCPHYARDPLGYLQFLAERLRADQYDVLLPTHEQSFLLARVRDALAQHVAVALPEFDAIRRMQNKADFMRLLDELELSHPPTIMVRDRGDLIRLAEFPCFVKTAHGTAGLGVREIHHADQLETLADELDRAGQLNGETEILIQRPAAGELAVAFGIFQHGRLVAHHITHVRKYGVGNVARESAAHAGVAEDLQRIGEHLRWHGAFFLDYFYDEATRGRQYIEANPRLGEVVNARLCGVNLCEQLIRVSLGEDMQPLPAGATGVRSHQGYLLALAAALEGRSRGQVLGEVMRARRGRGFYEGSQDELARPAEDWRSLIPAGAVVGQLAISPRSAKRIVRRAVEDYGLPGAAARAIAELPAEQLAACF